MMRIAGSALVIVAITWQVTCQVTCQVAGADEIRHTTFAVPMLGTWAQSADLCTKDDKSNFVISADKYIGAAGTCSVEVIVETAGSLGPNYSVRGRCTATPQSQAQAAQVQVENLIMRPQGAGKELIGKSFEDLKPYQHCPAN